MRQTIKELRYALYLARHPFKGFWEIKHEHEGSLKTAVILICMAIITQILSKLFTGYLFGGPKSADYNMFVTIIAFLSMFFGWCISNWCLTCLSDGKGTFKDICIAMSYTLVPYILIQLSLIILSNCFVLREQVFYNMIYGLSYVWTAFLVVVGLIVTHHFTLTRTIVVIIFTIVGIMAMACLLLLLFNLVQQVLGFVTIVIDEIILRLSY